MQSIIAESLKITSDGICGAKRYKMASWCSVAEPSGSPPKGNNHAGHIRGVPKENNIYIKFIFRNVIVHYFIKRKLNGIVDATKSLVASPS